jgi:hypothetical protein
MRVRDREKDRAQTDHLEQWAFKRATITRQNKGRVRKCPYTYRRNKEPSHRHEDLTAPWTIHCT